MEMRRIFVGLVLPGFAKEELGRLAEPMAGARWSPIENLHLTLRFIGDTDLEKQARYEEALARVKVQSFFLPLEGVGVFPPRRPPKVLWAGLGNAHPRLFQLRKQVDDALLRVDTGIDMRSFHPHITLARLEGAVDPKALERFLQRHKAFEGSLLKIESFHLFESELRPGRAPVYRSLREFTLGA